MQLLAWALYDLANTFFAVAILSFYFPMWVVEDQGAKELVFSAALAVSLAAVAIVMPICGAISDVTQQRLRYLRWTTLGCVAATALMAWCRTLLPALALFIVANFCYQLGTVFYDAMLWRLSSPERLGRASAFGASFGYLGSMAGLLLLWPFVRAGGHQAAFLPSAVFFLLFALPSFVILKDPPATSAIRWPETIRNAFLRLAMTVRSVRAYAPLWRLFLASFFSLNAINTVLVFMAVYVKTVMRFEEAQVITFFVWSQSFAVAGSLVFGRVIEWLGAKRTLSWIWTGWAVALGLAIASPAPEWMWGIGPVIGFCLGATWATSRTLIIELAPKEQLAEIFGLAGLLGRVSSIFGPLLWGLIVLDPSRYRHAVAALIGLLGMGIWLLRRVK